MRAKSSYVNLKTPLECGKSVIDKAQVDDGGGFGFHRTFKISELGLWRWVTFANNPQLHLHTL